MVLNNIVKSENDIRKALNDGLEYLIDEALNITSELPENAVLRSEGIDTGIPAIHSWKGIENLKISDVRGLFSDNTIEGIESKLTAGIEASMAYEIIASMSDKSLIPDSFVTEYGTGLIDSTFPGVVLFIGDPGEDSIDDIRYCLDRNLKVILAGRYSELDVELDVLRIGDRSLEVNGLLTRVVIRYGNVEPGDRVSLAKYLKKRPKLITVHTGTLTVLDVLTIFSAAAAGSYTVVNSIFPEIPRFSEHVTENMISTALAERGVTFKKGGKIRSGSSFENERIRKTDAFFEFGGNENTTSYEIVRVADDVEDGMTFVNGEDLQNLKKGDYPLSLEVRVSGTAESMMEQAIERRIHFALSRMEGVWHNGQRDTCWIRISNSAIEKGIRFKDLGDNIISDIKENFGSAVDSVDVAFSTVSSYVAEGLKQAKIHYSSRDEGISGLMDEDVDEFYTCTICQTYAPGHICIITPGRPSVCGSVTWIDAKIGSEIDPVGRQRPFFKGKCIDSEKGVWTGVNNIVSQTSMGSVNRVCIHSIVDSPMTACSCMEVVAAVSEDRRSIILIDRSEAGDNPSGLSYSEISAMVGRGSQHPGYMGLGRHYILSPVFLKGDGGLKRVSWMSFRLKTMLGASLRKACEIVGGPDFYDKIADGNTVTDASSLAAWIEDRNHPSRDMELFNL